MLLAGALLGARRGLLAVLLWVGVGAAGLPVFANGKSGLPVLVGPTGGYIVGFVLGAALLGLVVQRLARQGQATNPLAIIFGGIAALLVIHAVGIIGLNLRAGLDMVAAAKVDAAFWIGDILKLVATGLVAAAVHRAFPWLLRRGA